MATIMINGSEYTLACNLRVAYELQGQHNHKPYSEILAFGMQYKEKVPAIKDWSLSVDGTAAFSSTGSQKQLYDAFESGAGVTFGIYLDDTTYFEGTGYVSSLEIEAAPDDKISISSEVAGSGAVVMNLPS